MCLYFRTYTCSVSRCNLCQYNLTQVHISNSLLFMKDFQHLCQKQPEIFSTVYYENIYI